MPVPDFAQGIQYSFLDAAVRARRQAHAPIAAAGGATDPANAAAASGTTLSKAAESDPPLTFDDLVDVVNPLQHLPIVGTLYRHFTHDEIKPLPKIAGDALYGGWMGLASSVADYAFEKITGKNFGDTVLALVTGEDASATKTAVASATPPNTPNPVVVAASVKPADAPAVAAAAVPDAALAPVTKVAAADRPPMVLSGASQPIPTIDGATLDAFMTAVNRKGLPGDLSQRTVDAYRRTIGLQSPPASTGLPATLH